MACPRTSGARTRLQSPGDLRLRIARLRRLRLWASDIQRGPLGSRLGRKDLVLRRRMNLDDPVKVNLR